MVLKYVPISEFVAVTLIGSQVSADASFSEYEQSINREDTPFGADDCL